MSSNPCNFVDYRVETINRHTGLRMAVWSRAKICGRRLGLWPIGYSPALSMTYGAAAAAVASCGAI